MSHSFIDRNSNYFTQNYENEEPQKDIDPWAQLKELENTTFRGRGLLNNPPAQMFAKEEENESIQGKGLQINNSPVLENEADEMGNRVAKGMHAQVYGRGFGIQKYTGNPVKDMKIRRNRASNLGPGNVRNNGTKYHAGHDLQGKIGDPIYSVKDGIVEKIGNSPSGYGKYITIKHTEAFYREEEFEDGNTKEVLSFLRHTYSFYAHLSKIIVKNGDSVNENQKIGEMGVSGNALGMTGDDVHLHFEYGSEINSNGIIKKENRLDPNLVYDNVSFTSENNSTNQSVTGVIETNYDNDGNVINKIKHDYNTSKQKLIYPLPDKYSKNQY